MTKKVKQEVDQDIWWSLHKALVAAKENTEELLGEQQEESWDVSCKKSKAIEAMYEKELVDLTLLIQYSEDNGGVPF